MLCLTGVWGGVGGGLSDWEDSVFDRQAKQILHNTATIRPAHTALKSPHAGQPQNQHQTETHKTVSYANIVRQGRTSDCTQTKTTQTSPKQTHRNTPQTSTLKTQCTKHAQTLATQHATVGTDDTITVSTDTITDTEDDIID